LASLNSLRPEGPISERVFGDPKDTYDGSLERLPDDRVEIKPTSTAKSVSSLELRFLKTPSGTRTRYYVLDGVPESSSFNQNHLTTRSEHPKNREINPSRFRLGNLEAGPGLESTQLIFLYEFERHFSWRRFVDVIQENSLANKHKSRRCHKKRRCQPRRCSSERSDLFV
jgi:hypothetical protein